MVAESAPIANSRPFLLRLMAKQSSHCVVIPTHLQWEGNQTFKSTPPRDEGRTPFIPARYKKARLEDYR